MQIWCLLSLILAIISPLLAQMPPLSIAATDGTCLDECLKQRSLIFAASDLRNFGKIVVHIEEFCDTREKLLKCAQSCTGEEQEKLAKMASLSAYICKDKIEEFRLVKECMENQKDIDVVNKCSIECGHPSNATVQLDSSPAAPVNPFAFIDSIEQSCRTIECAMKCSITESNKICAGSGYLFRDIGFKQVLEANDQLENDAVNSSSYTQQLTKIYLESLPQQCTYIINPINYNMTFAQHGVNDEIRTTMLKISELEENTMKPSSIIDEERMKQMASEMFNTNTDDDITRIFNAEFTTQSIEASRNDDIRKEMEKEGTMMTTTPETEHESDIFMKSSTSNDVASTVESGDTSTKSQTSVHIHIQPISSHEAKGQEEKEEEGSIASLPVTSISADDRPRIMEENEEEGATVAANNEPEKEKQGRKDKEEDETITEVTQKSNDEEERENNDEIAHLQLLSTPVTIQEMTERTIIVVNDEKDQEINTNTIVQHTAVEQYQKDAAKQGIRERITLSLLLILPLISLYFSNQ